MEDLATKDLGWAQNMCEGESSVIKMGWWGCSNELVGWGEGCCRYLPAK